jgi:DNA mismatch repair ATPase MutL
MDEAVPATPHCYDNDRSAFISYVNTVALNHALSQTQKIPNCSQAGQSSSSSSRPKVFRQRNNAPARVSKSRSKSKSKSRSRSRSRGRSRSPSHHGSRNQRNRRNPDNGHRNYRSSRYGSTRSIEKMNHECTVASLTLCGSQGHIENYCFIFRGSRYYHSLNCRIVQFPHHHRILTVREARAKGYRSHYACIGHDH